MDYNKTAANVAKAIRKSGRAVTLRQYSVGGADYDVTSGKATPLGSDGSTDTVRYALTADQPGSQISQRFGQNRQGNTLVQQGEKWIYLDAQGARPSLQDHVIFDGVDYSILDVQELKPGLVPLFYLLVLRV